MTLGSGYVARRVVGQWNALLMAGPSLTLARRWAAVEDEILWRDRFDSPVAHVRLLPRNMNQNDLHLIANDLQARNSRRERRLALDYAADGLRMAARFLLAERAITKPPSRARGPAMVLALAFARLETEYRRGTDLALIHL